MMNALSVVNLFKNPFEIWSMRSPTKDEIFSQGISPLAEIKDRKKATIRNNIQAAQFMANEVVSIELGNYVNSFLDKSKEYKEWRRHMPSKTPKEILRYQKKYPNCNLSDVDLEINKISSPMPVGQVLFHGGDWVNQSPFVSNRPLSTSLCPQVALRNAGHNGKSYNAGKVDLLVIKIVGDGVKAFVMKRKGSSIGHENEVLLASGLTFEVRRIHSIRSNYEAYDASVSIRSKLVPIRVLELDVV